MFYLVSSVDSRLFKWGIAANFRGTWANFESYSPDGVVLCGLWRVDESEGKALRDELQARWHSLRQRVGWYALTSAETALIRERLAGYEQIDFEIRL